MSTNYVFFLSLRNFYNKGVIRKSPNLQGLCESLINFLCCCNSAGEPRPDIQLVINSSKYMRDFIGEHPPDFQISAKCCDYCKKQLAHSVQKGYEMIITGERRDEGGTRSVPRNAYDTLACVGSLTKSCKEGDMLSESEILALQCNTPDNMENVNNPSKHYIKLQRKKSK